MAIKKVPVRKYQEYAEAIIEAIIETIRDPLVLLDADLRVLIANRSFYKILHVKKNEI